MRSLTGKGVLALCGLGLVMVGGTVIRADASPRTEALAGRSVSGNLTLVVSPARDGRKIEQLKRSLQALPGVRRVFLGPTNGDAVELQVAGSVQIDGQAVQRTAEQLGFTVNAMSVANAESGFQSTRNTSTIGGDPFSIGAFALGRHWFGSGDFRAFNRHSKRSAAGTASRATSTTGAQGRSNGGSSDNPPSANGASAGSSSNAAAGASSDATSSGGAAGSSGASSSNAQGSASTSSGPSGAVGSSSTSSAGTTGSASAASSSTGEPATATATATAIQGPIQRVAFLAGPVPSRLEASQLIQTLANRPGVRDVIILPMPGRRGVAQVSLAVDSSASAKDIRAAAESIGISVLGSE